MIRMSTNADKLVSEIRDLPDHEKLRLVDVILSDLDKPDAMKRSVDLAWSSLE